MNICFFLTLKLNFTLCFKDDKVLHQMFIIIIQNESEFKAKKIRSCRQVSKQLLDYKINDSYYERRKLPSL